MTPGPFQATWLPDGSGYTTLETPSGALQPELIRYDAASGNRTVLASLSHLTPAGRSEPLSISSYQFAPDGTWALLGPTPTASGCSNPPPPR